MCVYLVILVDTTVSSLEYIIYSGSTKHVSFIAILNVFKSVHSELTLKGKGIVHAERHWKQWQGGNWILVKQVYIIGGVSTIP